MSIVIIDNYDSFTYNLYQLIRTVSTDVVTVFRNDAVAFDDLVALIPTHIVLSPGPGHPSNDADFGVCKDIVRRNAELKRAQTLGVCLGHQGIVHHLGGKVSRAPEIVHGKQSAIRVCSPSPLFKNVDREFIAMRYHSLIADERFMPETLTVIARESIGNLVMAVEHKSAPLYGIQFHPESFATPSGRTIMENFLAL